MNTIDPADLARMIEELGLSPEEVAQRLAAPAPASSLTVAEHVKRTLAGLEKNTRRTYRTSLERFCFGFGPVCDQQCEPCCDPKLGFRCQCSCSKCVSSALTLPDLRDVPVGPAVYNRRAIDDVDTVAKRIARRRGVHENRLRAQKGLPAKNADGVGAQETAVAGMRHLFQSVPDLIDGYAGLDYKKPHRTSRERRPLLDFELVELHHETATGGNDPELDILMTDFALETGARRSGVYGLTVGQIRPETQIVRIKDKYQRYHDAPVSARLIERLLEHARTRGGMGSDPFSRAYRPDAPVSTTSSEAGVATHPSRHAASTRCMSAGSGPCPGQPTSRWPSITSATRWRTSSRRTTAPNTPSATCVTRRGT